MDQSESRINELGGGRETRICDLRPVIGTRNPEFSQVHEGEDAIASTRGRVRYPEFQ
jgi:hypothetical protein